jgi:hypothetical protein
MYRALSCLKECCGEARRQPKFGCPTEKVEKYSRLALLPFRGIRVRSPATGSSRSSSPAGRVDPDQRARRSVHRAPLVRAAQEYPFADARGAR